MDGLTDAQRAYEHNVARFGEHLHSIGVGLVAPCRTDGCRLSWDHPGDCAVAPIRVQLSRTRGWRKPANTVVVARPSRWGNPYRLGDVVRRYPSLTEREAAAFVVAAFRHDLRHDYPYYPLDVEIRDALAGKDLACWCPLVDDQGNPWPCHADVLLQIANVWEVQ